MSGGRGCLVSNAVTVDGHPIRFMFRSEPVDDVDSGWNFLSGAEPEGAMDDPAAHRVFDLDTVTAMDPSVAPFLAGPIGAAFEKVPGAADFVPVEDWDENA